MGETLGSRVGETAPLNISLVTIELLEFGLISCTPHPSAMGDWECLWYISQWSSFFFKMRIFTGLFLSEFRRGYSLVIVSGRGVS